MFSQVDWPDWEVYKNTTYPYTEDDNVYLADNSVSGHDSPQRSGEGNRHAQTYENFYKCFLIV